MDSSGKEKEDKKLTERKNDTKRKKSGYDYRQLKKAKERQEIAGSCSKITDLFKNHSQKPEVQDQQFNEGRSNLGPTNSPKETGALICNEKADETHIHSKENHKEEVEFNSDFGKKVSGSMANYFEPESGTYQAHDRDLAVVQAAQIDSMNYEFNLFRSPRKEDLDFFFSKHPLLPSSEEFFKKDVPFSKGIFFIEGENIERRWLTYNSAERKLYCSVCLAFSGGNSIFCSGFNDWKHTKQRIIEHENSKSHNESALAFLMLKKEKNVKWLVFQEQINKRQAEAIKRRSVLVAVIEVVKLIGKQGLALRNKSEAAYTLIDPTVNHGHFFEILLLLAQYDENLALHIKKVSEKSADLFKKRVDKSQNKFGRGKNITFFSKTTLMNIVNLLAFEIKLAMAEEIKMAGMFSIMMDTTIDISAYDQCSIAARYVYNGAVQERVLALKHVTSTSGDSLFETLKMSLADLGLSIENCVADSFDGASNMSGVYKGVSAKLTQANSNHIHTWCYAHILNLVITDTVQSSNACISFFGLLQETQVFLKDSQKRLAIYLEQNPNVRLEVIGETRWRSKCNAATKIFGNCSYWSGLKEFKQNKSKAVYVELLTTLQLISSSNQLNAKVRHDATCILQKFCSFQTILVAMTFLKIFQHTTPLSDYLQTSGLDYLQAWRMVNCTLDNVKAARNTFEEIYKAAELFVSAMTDTIEKRSETIPCLEDIVLETELPVERPKRRKKMPGELSSDEVITDSKHRFQVSVFNCIIDQVVSSMEDRFLINQNLYLDLECFDPKRFGEMSIGSVELTRITQLIPNCEEQKLLEELISFISMWKNLSKPLVEDYSTELTKETEELLSDFEDLSENEFSPNETGTNIETDLNSIRCKNYTKCNSCFKCAFDILFDYNMYSRLYPELFKVYKYVLTLPVTQVSCERSFSKLKIIKSRLRSRLTDAHLESLFLMNVEKDLLIKIDNDNIINRLCEKSEELRRLLYV